MTEFGNMLEQEIPSLRRYARQLTYDRALADDLVQSALVRALVKQHLWQPGTNLRHWLFTILNHERINSIRALLREQRMLADDRVALTQRRVTGAVGRLELREMDRALAGLPTAQRRVLLLIGFEGCSYVEAAQTLGVPLGTVRSRAARARTALRQILDRDDPRSPRKAA